MKEKMKVLGYLNPNGYTPTYLIMVLRSLSSGRVYYAWPRPCIKEISDWQENNHRVQEEFMEEVENKELEIDPKDLGSEHEWKIAFTKDGKTEGTGIFSTVDLYCYMGDLLQKGELPGDAKRLLRYIYDNYWKEPGRVEI
ncbi:hypothetical protein C0584_04870 [Candidatus Parcubacteria bacterium]|nr:MAG: hypothetical protein C0584_04870 [Candidatus Parcubacteria bacterium]